MSKKASGLNAGTKLQKRRATDRKKYKTHILFIIALSQCSSQLDILLWRDHICYTEHNIHDIVLQ